jgi:uncharacterized small protein (DUF1192 family)
MALVLADRVQETTTTAGIGTVTLAGAVAGYQSFATIGNGNTTYYTLVNGSNWEVGIGTYTSAGTTLSRDTVLASSAGGTTKITLSGTTSVFVTYPAERSVNLDGTGVLAVAANEVITSASANALAVGRVGTTNPVLNVDASTASVATGLNVKGAAATGGVAVSAISSGANENLTIDAKGSGTVTINGTATGGITLTRAATMSSTATATAFIPSSSSVPTNGMYLPAANSVGFATNSANRAKFDANGCFVFDTATNNATTDNAISFRSANNQMNINGSSASGGNLTLQGDGGGRSSIVIYGATGTNADNIQHWTANTKAYVIYGQTGQYFGDNPTNPSSHAGRVHFGGAVSGGQVIALGAGVNTVAAPYSMFANPQGSGIYTLDSSTASNQCWRFINPNGTVGGVTISGTTSTFNSTSDERLKNFDVPQRDFKSMIQNIMVKDGEFLSAPGDRFLMISAQQTAEIGYADAVEYPPDKKEHDDQPQNIYWSADYGRLAPLALWGVKDLYAEIETLKAEIEALKAKVS